MVISGGVVVRFAALGERARGTGSETRCMSVD